MNPVIQKAYLLLSEGKPQEALEVLQEAIITPEVKFNHDVNDIYEAMGLTKEMGNKAHDFAYNFLNQLDPVKGFTITRAIEQIMKSSFPICAQIEIGIQIGRHYSEMQNDKAKKIEKMLKFIESLKKIESEVNPIETGKDQ
jgi:hypothetical protein